MSETQINPWGEPNYRSGYTEFRPTGRLWIAQECEAWMHQGPEWLEGFWAEQGLMNEMLHLMVEVDVRELAAASDLLKANDFLLVAAMLKRMAVSRIGSRGHDDREREWKRFLDEEGVITASMNQLEPEAPF